MTNNWSSILRPSKDVVPRGIALKQSATISFGTVIFLSVFPGYRKILCDNFFDMTSGTLPESIRAHDSVPNTLNLANLRSQSGFLSIFICSICLIRSVTDPDGIPRSRRIIIFASSASPLISCPNVSPQFVPHISASTS